MTEKQMAELKGFIQFQTERVLQAQDEQMALLINTVRPGELEPCSHCNMLTTKPFRNNADHGDDFCSAACLEEYVEECEEEVEEDARNQADAKIPKKHEQLWDAIVGGTIEGPAYTHRGVVIEDVALQYKGDEEQQGGCEGEDGKWVKYYYAAEDGTHVCECVCDTCKKKFEIAAEKLLKGKGHACPHCKGNEEGQ